MGTIIHTGNDVVSFLKQQHEQIKSLFETVSTSHGDQRSKAFYALRRLIAVHETAEEEIVHPAARRALPDGNLVVDARLREENAAKKVLGSLESLDVDSIEFEAKLNQLKTDVIAHADAEERTEFDRLGSYLDPERLARMRRAAEIAEAIAPTRPHAGVESPLANLLVGPFAAMLDRSRDALSRKG